MHALDRVLPTPLRVERDFVELDAPPERVWERVRHADLSTSPLVKALFSARTIADEGAAPRLSLDALESTPVRPGFQLLIDDPPRELVVGAIGKVWQLDIPFVHVDDAVAFAAFDEPGFVRVAWAIQLSPLGERGTRLDLEVRVDATDEASWKKFRAYFLVVGPGSRFIRWLTLRALAQELGALDDVDEDRSIAGDDLLPDADAQLTHGVTIAAPPERIWPWLVQMGCHRAGFYSYDFLDNAGVRSAREIHADLKDVRVGDVLPASPDEPGGFEVLRIEPNRALVLGGLFDAQGGAQLAFKRERPAHFWHVTWAFELEPLDAERTRLHVRARAAFSPDQRLHATWIRPVHHLMEAAQLRGLAARAEGRLPRDDWRDVVEGMGGMAVMAAAFATPFMRHARSHWGLDEETAGRAYPGDAFIPEPRWSWTHGIEIDVPVDEVWPWVAQLGADRGGFYSYQWLENLAGCDIHNAESLHSEWLTVGKHLSLAPGMPPLPIVDHVPGRYFLVHGRPTAGEREAGTSVEVTWLFWVEPLSATRSRVISRYRCATSDDVATRLRFGPLFIEPIGFAMDRRMLLGIKRRAEQRLRRGDGSPAPRERAARHS